MTLGEFSCSGTDFRGFVEGMLGYHGRVGHDFCFMQVGTNDGVSDDPLHRWIEQYQWSGVLVEPVGSLLDKAREVYRDRPNLTFVNAAVADHDGVATFFTVRDDPGINPMARMLASLHKDVILRHVDAIPQLEDRIEVRQVPCLTLKSLFARHQIRHLDLFHVDAEGADFEIVRQFDSIKIYPKMLMMEHKHLSEAAAIESRKWLQLHSYEFVIGPYDTFAYMPETSMREALET